MLIPLSPPPGLDSDDTTFSAKGRWADGCGVRFRLGKAETVGGDSAQFTIAGSPTLRSVYPFVRAATVMVAYGGRVTAGTNAAKLYIGTGLASPTSRSPVTTLSTSDVDGWALASWGDTLLAAPYGSTTAATGLYSQSGTSTAAIIATAPAKMNWMLVTPERQVLALGTNEEVSTTFNPMCIRGCDLEDYTNWTTSPTNNAFEHILEGSGQIVSGRVLGSYVAVWTNNALYLGQFIGDPGQAYRFDKIDENCGLVGAEAVTILNGVAYWMTPDLSFRAWSPGSLPRRIPCSLSKYINSAAGLSWQYLNRTSTNSRFGEVRFDIRTGAANGFYVALNVEDGTWYRGDQERTAICESAILSPLTGGLDNATIIAALSDAVFIQEVGIAGVATHYIQSGDQYLDQGNRRVMIKRFIPDITRSGNLSLTVYTRDYPSDTPTTHGPYTFTSTKKKVDFRASGRIVSVRITSDNIAFRLGVPVFEAEPMGIR